MRDQVQQILDTLRRPGGLYVASPSATYHYVWIRDICYIALSELHQDNDRFEETYHGILDIFKKYEWKLRHHATTRPNEAYEYIHPRYTLETLEEVHEPWGNAQNDAIGAFLFGIGQGLRRGKKMLRDERDRQIILLLVQYLTTLKFWVDEDNGMWEENRECHASSIGACVAGMLAIQPYFDISWDPIQKGLSALFQILPRESATKESDLALLSLIYPYDLLPHAMSEMLIRRVEDKLLRQNGVIRYEGDLYYQADGQEAQWCMGLPWLGLCHVTMGNLAKAEAYLRDTEKVMVNGAKIPELYVMREVQPNENTPLGWSHALWLILCDAVCSENTQANSRLQ